MMNSKPSVKIIHSPHNETLAQIVSLETSKGRRAHQLFKAEGVRVCTTLSASSLPLMQLYVTEPLLSTALAFVPKDKVTLIPLTIMKKISSCITPPGILGIFAIPPQPAIDTLSSGIVLSQIQDPGNMGTLIRTAAACGLHSVVLINGTDPWSPKVIQASAGTVGHINIFQTDWETIKQQKQSLHLVGLVPQGGQTVDKVITAERSTLLIIGNETHGIHPLFLKECDTLLTLPMPGHIESLNAAVAGAIAMYTLFVLK
ncbi:MAG: RNA methyltransferase [Candidatus Babeliales bacterium]